MLVSLFVGIAQLVYTYSVHDGFAKSISFNGGVRLSVQMPEGQGKPELLAAARRAGIEGAEVRPISQKQNLYDLDLGPEVRDRLLQEAAKRGVNGSTTDLTADMEKSILSAVQGATPASIISRETISASYGQNLFEMSVKSLLITMIAIGIYLSFRFDLPFALGASLALVHDVILTLGFIGVMQIEPSIPVLAAVLTIIGYSINDTIVIFDRIREMATDRTQMALTTMMDQAITKTLTRTVITSLLTLISVVAILMGGAESLKDFALIMAYGIVVGTYSSIFIASHFVQVYLLVFKKGASLNLTSG
jgi:preprotein translocase subunit SecF